MKNTDIFFRPIIPLFTMFLGTNIDLIFVYFINAKERMQAL
ncbi:metal-dependent phosphoesterases [Candidatus Brocadia sinica JPN1]|uniref:Metal-dependent phosphoesterases n=1 Tax=Candidatus Brocadia sinica JPN1 TaxID=1197129 RepID=A0ABQ0JVA5_9BACT|nr:metal-dependent phosphoesterases [Candidatus Brocadia sinica JPN1]